MIKNFARVLSAQAGITSGTIIAIEADITNGLHQFTLVGLPTKSVDEAKDRVSSALKNSGYKSPKQANKKIIISLTPAEYKKEGTSFDCAMAIAYLVASGQLSCDLSQSLIIGELSLNGEIKAVHSVVSMVRAARKANIATCYVPKQTFSLVGNIPDITCVPVSNLSDLINQLERLSYDKDQKSTRVTNTHLITNIADDKPVNGSVTKNTSRDFTDPFSKISGQHLAKRALEIAAAGNHHVLMIGPPGTGKTLLARAFSQLLPRLDYPNMLTVTNIWSYASKDPTILVHSPPFRNPHHTISLSELIGSNTKVGEITLAHKGVLFLDEFLELGSDLINALRQPLEDHTIIASHHNQKEIIPADFILIAATNPCPCGYFGSSDKACLCTPNEISRYRKKLSGPILDRIDLWIPVEQTTTDMNTLKSSTPYSDIYKRIIHARNLLNTKITNPENTGDKLLHQTRKPVLNSSETEQLFQELCQHFHLSERSKSTLLRVAQTIAYLEDYSSESISKEFNSGNFQSSHHATPREIPIQREHLLEAFQYRRLNV